MAIGAHELWVQVGEIGAVRIERATKRVTATVDGVTGLAFAGSDLWAAAIDRVLQLDPTTGAVLAQVRVGSDRAFHIAVGADAVWLSGGGAVTRIDPVAKRVAATTAVPACTGQRSLAFGHGSVWVGCKDAGEVVRIDPATSAVVATIRTGAGAHHLAIGENAVWVTNYAENTVSRIDPVTNATVAKIRGVGSGVGLAASDRFVWAATSLGVAKIDPTTNTVRSRIRLEPARFHYDIQLVEGSLWVSSVAGRIYRINPNA
jgi:YVTN family beta-propeller protein